MTTGPDLFIYVCPAAAIEETNVGFVEDPVRFCSSFCYCATFWQLELFVRNRASIKRLAWVHSAVRDGGVSSVHSPDTLFHLRLWPSHLRSIETRSWVQLLSPRYPLFV